MLCYRTLVLRDGKEILTRNEVPSADGAQLVVRPVLVGICRSEIKKVLDVRTARSDFGHVMIGEVVAANTPKLPTPGTFVVLHPRKSIQRSSGYDELLVAAVKAIFLAVTQQLQEVCACKTVVCLPAPLSVESLEG